MYQVVIVFHVLLGLSVIGLVLMQQGKGADAGAAFGSGASGSVFGAQGAASFLSRTTAILASFFFVTSLTLAILVGYQNSPTDLMDEPETINIKSDVPLVDNMTGSESAMPSVPAMAQEVNDAVTGVAEQAQVLTEETVEQVNDVVRTGADQAVEFSETAAGKIADITRTVVDEAQKGSEELEKAIVSE